MTAVPPPARRTVFGPDEAGEAAACITAEGYAIVRGSLGDRELDELEAELTETRAQAPGFSHGTGK